MNSVSLRGITKPYGFTYSGKPGGDIETAEDLIAYCARVSNPANQHNTETSEKLLKYLVRNKHWSPFEMVHIVMEIKTTRDIARQILRHRSFSFQEFSQRYAEVAEMSEPREVRLQDPNNRQNSVYPENDEMIPYSVAWEMKQQQMMHEAKLAYKWALENGIAKEQARVVLPEGLTMSTMYMSGSLRSWIHYCDLRMGNGTQMEHRDVAKQCWEIIKREFPSLEGVLEQ